MPPAAPATPPRGNWGRRRGWPAIRRRSRGSRSALPIPAGCGWPPASPRRNRPDRCSAPATLQTRPAAPCTGLRPRGGRIPAPRRWFPARAGRGGSIRGWCGRAAEENRWEAPEAARPPIACASKPAAARVFHPAITVAARPRSRHTEWAIPAAAKGGLPRSAGYIAASSRSTTPTDHPSWIIWCMLAATTWSFSARRSRTTRTSGPFCKSIGRPISSATLRRNSHSRSDSGTWLKSMTGNERIRRARSPGRDGRQSPETWSAGSRAAAQSRSMSARVREC